jgi:dephospho-CoA kinase
MIKVGLTGNIGSGKTVIAEIFHRIGIPVFNADIQAKNLYKQAEVKAQLTALLGPDIFDGSGNVDRKRMAQLLFHDKGLLQQVNQWIHPMVRDSFHRFGEVNKDKPYVVYEAAIVVESGYYKELDKLIVVSAPEKMRIERVMSRDGIPRQEVLNRARHQLTDNEKNKVADWIINNDGAHLIIPQILEVDRQLRMIS